MKTSLIKIIFIICALSLSGTSTAQNKTYVIGVEDLDYLPYFSSNNNEYTGFAREILDAFAKEHGYVFKYSILPVKRLLTDFLNQKVDFKFPDNPYWKTERKKRTHVIYSNPVVEIIDGVMVRPMDKGKGIKSIKTLGTVLGFTPWDYLDLIAAKTIKLNENPSFTGLIKQALTGRVDGAYINPTVGNYQLEVVLKKPNELVFDPDLPHVKSFYMLSSIKHPKIIEEFNRFLVEKQQMVESLKNKHKVKGKFSKSIGMFTLQAIVAEPVKIAAIFAKTGIAAEHNKPYIQMTELSVEEINSQGGLLGRPVELIVLDNKSTPIGSSLAAEEAVRLQAAAVIGAAWSSHSLAIAPILQRAGIPMITPLSTNPKVTRIGNYIFRACFLDSFQGKAMATYAYTELKARTSVVLKITNEEYSMVLAEFFAGSFKGMGGRVLWEGCYKNKSVDFTDILKKVKKIQPDVVYVSGYSRDSGLLINQAVSMGIKSTFLGGDGWSGNEIYIYGGNALDGSYYSGPWHPDAPFPESRHLQEIYRKKFGTTITDVNQPLVYDAFMLLANAVDRAGTLDRTSIRDALSETKGFQGVTGIITFDENGDPMDKEAFIIKLGKDAPVYIKTVKP